MRKKIILGITGASGVIYGIRFLELASACGVDVHLVVSRSGKKNIELETNYSFEKLKKQAHTNYDDQDLAAAISSGSYLIDGMIIAPCTVKTLSSVANSFTSNLITRAADVTLKEKRKLILMVRETPLHKGHLQLMMTAADIGATILPPVPAFYHHPKCIEDIIDHTVGRALDHFGIEHDLVKRWE